MPNSEAKSLAAALAGAVGISFSAILVRAASVTPITAAVFRTGYALPLLALIWWKRRGADRRGGSERRLGLVAGVFLALDLFSWHVSIDYIGAGLATVLGNLQVVVVAVLAWMILGERPSRRVFTAVPLVVAGATLVSGLGRSDAYGQRPLLGTALGLLTAVFYGCYLLIFRQANVRQASSAGPLLEVCLAATLTSLLIGGATGQLDPVPAGPDTAGCSCSPGVHRWEPGWLSVMPCLGFRLPKPPP